MMSLIHPIHLPSRWDWWDMTVGVPAVGLIWPGPRRRPLNASTFHVRFYTGPPDMRTVPSCASLCQLVPAVCLCCSCFCFFSAWHAVVPNITGQFSRLCGWQ